MSFTRTSVPQPMQVLKHKCSKCGHMVEALVKGICPECATKNPIEVSKTITEDKAKCS